MNALDTFLQINKINQGINDFKDQLLFKGVTYYEGIYVFEHLQEHRQKEVFNLTVQNVELGFKDEKLVSIWYYLLDVDIDRLVVTLKDIFQSEGTLNTIPDILRTYDIVKLYWKKDDCFIALGTKDGKEYLYITDCDSVLPYISNTESHFQN